MRISIPIRIDGVWHAVHPTRLTTQLLGKVVRDNFQLRDLCALTKPLIQEMADGKLDIGSARMRLWDQLSVSVSRPYFEVDGIRQELLDDEEQWIDLFLTTNSAVVMTGSVYAQNRELQQVQMYPSCLLTPNHRKKGGIPLAQRWIAAGGVLHRSKMIALKWDRLWERFGELGHVHEPFFFDTWETVEEISIGETRDAGLRYSAGDVRPLQCPGCLN